MIGRIKRRLLHLFSLSTLLVCIAPFSFADTLVLAQLSDLPKKDYKQLRPMVEYAASQLTHLGVTKGEVKLYSDLDELVQALKAGEVHWVTETPYAAAILVHEAAAVPLLMKWKSNQRRYQTLIYTHKNSGLSDINQLKGKRIAFEHQTSFSSYFLPRMQIEQAGMAFHPLANRQDKNQPEEVNYLFSRNEKNNLLWVHKGLVDAGALNNGDWNNPKRVPESLKPDLRIIYKSDFYPRALELVSPHMTPQLRQGLKKLLLGLTPEHNGDLLYRYEKSGGFEELEQDIDKTFAEIYSYRGRYTQ